MEKHKHTKYTMHKLPTNSTYARLELHSQYYKELYHIMSCEGISNLTRINRKIIG